MIYTSTDENIQIAAQIIKDGGLVAFPTETVYGLGGNALDVKAVAAIFEAKKRPSFDPLITHIADHEMLDELADIKDQRIYDLASEFWPGALTLIVPKRDIIPSLVTSGLQTMAVRMPDHPIALSLIRQSSGAVAAPSANSFGYLSPTEARHVEEDLGSRIDMILDGGACRVGVESTVLDLTREHPIILRPGGLTRQEIESVLGPVDLFNRTSTSPTAPGQLEMHYSPRKPLHVVEDLTTLPDKGSAGALIFSDSSRAEGFAHSEILAPSGNVLEAASRLFSALHSLDQQDISCIYAEFIPEEGLGQAVMDRIYKASEK
ncbi:L-threonylcarbamoyladenylate synthase [Oceanispirochaeta sp.]|jgi:L-threonylcarbamoyladenylate synthase|uniref:L-threonylcarbamoyladenylate synthase n=1 Tax=Oceanispirochaeta sp. TaxID=2035350 RepID=UPI00260444CE|nr:L-threonylcarbamoyladenylate synthase [Oceanispirochaeta sp.]MDA3956707.1 L-threonylcarbamoyladenylate synthase [Oceanispirochaeta sp.]